VAAVWQVWQRGRCDDGIDRISAVILVPNSGVWQQCGSGSGSWQLEVGGVAQVDRSDQCGHFDTR
jgi:hypothetical protein